MKITTIFKLKNEFVNRYIDIRPPFGFNGLGEMVYLRTYSRLKEDGTNEKWYETVRRVVEGTYTIQKNHIISNALGWEEDKAHDSAEEMYDRMFYMKFLPPGRGLWAMGTSIINEKGLYTALNNCAFYSTSDMDKDPTRPFEFLMDLSMLGVGVGFDTKGAGKVTIQSVIDTYDYIIPDTREGWVDSLKLILACYFDTGQYPVFDYSHIRPYGASIKTFGGKASGPEPLKKLHKQITDMFSTRTGTNITVTDIVDIMNMIGVCVVAGNVRRTAEIALGDWNDQEYLQLKEYTYDNETNTYLGKMARRSSFGWASNNSVFCTVGIDYTNLAKQTAINGEPGYAWLNNMQKYSRMNGKIDNKDFRVKGMNPCGEQSLESGEMCCLVETFPTMCTDKEDFLRTLKFAYLYGKTVTLGTTHWVDTNRVMLRNRRIGTSMSGIAQFLDTKGIEELRKWTEDGYTTIQKYDCIYSDWFAIPKSIKTTSIKPSGTVSLLPGVTPGIHFPEANYYIRRMRISKTSEMLEDIKNKGYKVEDSITDVNTSIVEIPIHISGVRTINQVSMWEQLNLAAFIQEHWADNQVSCTVTVKSNELNQIKNALNYYQYKLKAISFLPKPEKYLYAQMPYEEITEKQYNKSVVNIKDIAIEINNEDSKPELFCDGDNCTIL